MGREDVSAKSARKDALWCPDAISSSDPGTIPFWLCQVVKVVKVLLSLKSLWLLGTICMETIIDLAWATP